MRPPGIRFSSTGAVTLIQCFGSSLNLNVHFHMLFLDGVYVEGRPGTLKRFQWVKAPSSDELTRLTHTIARRVGRFLEHQGLLESDAENCYLTGDAADDDSMAHLHGHSITYRIAVGPHQGRKGFTLQTLPPVILTIRTRWARPPGSRCMPGWRPKPGNGTSCNACAGISHDRPYPRNACR